MILIIVILFIAVALTNKKFQAILIGHHLEGHSIVTDKGVVFIDLFQDAVEKAFDLLAVTQQVQNSDAPLGEIFTAQYHPNRIIIDPFHFHSGCTSLPGTALTSFSTT